MRLSAYLTIGLAAVAPAELLGQPTAAAPAFEVASVKPASPQDRVIALFTYPGGRITASLYTLEMLIEEAFDVPKFQVSGGPHWIQVDRFDLEAKPPASSPSSKANPPYPKAPPNAEQRQMLAALLADRFQLHFHRETREGPIYLLVRGSQALKLHKPQDPNAFPWAGGGNGLQGANITMPQLATRLRGFLSRQVLDRTGLDGSFDFKVELASGDPAPDVLSSIFASVQAIGLKLEASKGPVETIVIDHAEKPLEN
ncbi:MAG TPA: TIGR03435 family protein [Bryobacteraceae bacterium]|nr:TIGR03435 family protein [Bryobacteraceae bacterium]